MVVSVKIEFTPNEFFTNDFLQYTLRFEEGEKDETIEAVIGTDIVWKDKRKNVCRKRVRKTQKHRESGKMRTVYAEKQKPSFFNIFKS